MAIEVVYSDQPLSHHTHAHVCYEMLYLVEGEAALSIRGREYRARGGDLVFLNQLEEHATRVLQAPYRRYYALLPPQISRAFQRDMPLLSVFRLHGGDFPYVLSTGDRRNRFDFYFSLLLDAAGQPAEDAQCRGEALLTLILTEARALRPDMFAEDVQGGLLPIREILDTLDREFAGAFSLSDLARRYHVSPGCLSAHFRRYVGMSPMQYVIQSRLAQAKQLLVRTDWPIRRVARECGFADQSNFTRRFKAQFQATPQQFRSAGRPASGARETPEGGETREK